MNTQETPNEVVNDAVQALSNVEVESSTNTGTEVAATLTPAKKSRKKAEKAPVVETVVAPTVPMLKVNGLKVADVASKNPREMAVDTTFVVGQKSIALHTSLDTVISELVEGKDLNTPVAIPRKTILNRFCIANSITPLPCKQSNKTENKTTSTYGHVPEFADKFDVAGATYQTLGFLKFPLVRTANWTAIKHDVYLLVMTEATYQLFATENVDMLKDQQFEIL